VAITGKIPYAKRLNYFALKEHTMISQVKHVSVPVKNQDAALEFYTKKLGFKLAVDVVAGNQRWIELEIPGGETCVVLFTPEGHEERIGSLSNIIFTAENIDETVEKLKANGVHFVQEPVKESWGTYALFSDLDGNTFCISSS